MFIGIDKKYRIKQIADSAEGIVSPSLTVIEIDRQAVFGNWSDRRILAYCYKPMESGYSIYPGRDLTKIDIEDNKEATEKVAQRVAVVDVTQSIAFVTLAEAGQIDDVTASEHPEMFEEWKPNMAYTEGQLRIDPLDGKLYRVNKGKSHTSQEGWNPSLCQSEWKLTSDPAEEFPAWSQPIGAHDAYGEGAKVTHKDKKWVCTEVDANGNNTWPPGVYGWTEYVEGPEV